MINLNQIIPTLSSIKIKTVKTKKNLNKEYYDENRTALLKAKRAKYQLDFEKKKELKQILQDYFNNIPESMLTFKFKTLIIKKATFDVTITFKKLSKKRKTITNDK